MVLGSRGVLRCAAGFRLPERMYKDPITFEN